MAVRMPNPPLPEHLPPGQRERVAVLTIIHEGETFSPAEVYRRFDPEPDPELARLPTLLEGLWAALAPRHSEGSRRVLARVSGAQRPFLAAWQGEDSEGDGFAMETLALCDTCPVPEACALRGQCRVNQETPGAIEAETSGDHHPASPETAASRGHERTAANREPPTLPWHTLAAVDAQAQAEAQGQIWLNAPGMVEQVLSHMQAANWAAWHAWWRGWITKAEAHYRRRVEVSWAAAIFAGRHPGIAILPAWHLEQMPDYLRRVYYHQAMMVEWEDVPDQETVVQGVLEACAEAAGLQLQRIEPSAPGEAGHRFIYGLAEEADMAEDVVMHAAFFRGLVRTRARRTSEAGGSVESLRGSPGGADG
ncbi:hypothetical protein [Vreelandella massiliensis]|uniref:hypothetical protein n=1 Tax=Vreelandella massiliensis TaxID=1816686 RepID=UPI001181A153|nr:hypothetical protein [Halomonas massiliensis]